PKRSNHLPEEGAAGGTYRHECSCLDKEIPGGVHRRRCGWRCGSRDALYPQERPSARVVGGFIMGGLGRLHTNEDHTRCKDRIAEQSTDWGVMAPHLSTGGWVKCQQRMPSSGSEHHPAPRCGL